MPLRTDLVRFYPDGAVVFDPVTGRTSSLSREGAELIAALCALIDGGLQDREALIRMVRAEAGEDGSGGAVATDGGGDAHLAAWVDLALHLNA